MNIALTTDSKFIPHCTTTICSICENNKDENIIFFIIHNGLNIATQNIFTNFINKYKNKKIEFYLFPEHLLKDFPVYQEGQPQHISLATYYRLFITKFLPENIDKLIYLDCDIIVRKSLKELWDIKIDNFSSNSFLFEFTLISLIILSKVDLNSSSRVSSFFSLRKLI